MIKVVAITAARVLPWRPATESKYGVRMADTPIHPAADNAFGSIAVWESQRVNTDKAPSPSTATATNEQFIIINHAMRGKTRKPISLSGLVQIDHQQ